MLTELCVQGQQALQLFGEMRQRFQPTETQTFDILKVDPDSTFFFFPSLLTRVRVQLLARSGMVKEAIEVFEAMKFGSLPRPDISSYGEMIYMYAS